MAEEERIPSLLEKDGIDTSQPKDTYVPEEPTPDVSISLLDIQMPETPDSTKGQTSDGDVSRLESPKAVKPVLGKVQAKKRLMAFANQFKALSKSQVKPNLSQHSTGALKAKDKTIQDDININKSRKKTEEKILAIEEIRREESKSKMLLAEAMAAASMEDENHTGKNTSGLLESTRHTKGKNKHERTNDDRKSRSMDRKYSERHRHRDKIDRDGSNQDVKDRNGSIERFTQKSSQNKEKHKKDKKRKDKDKRDNSKTDANHDKKEEGKDKKEIEKEKQDESKEKTEGTKNRKENMKERRNDMLEIEVEGKDKKEKDKDKLKEKMLLKSNSWVEVRKSGLTLDDIIHLRRRDNSERSVKIRTTQDYTRYLEQMLMLSNHRLKRQALIAEGLDGPKKYPPESIKLTKRARGLQLLYCENPRTSLLLGISQLLQIVTPERREKIRDICAASSPQRIDTEDTVQQKRNWYQQINTIKSHKDSKWQMTVQLPKSKWDSEDEETSSISVAKEEIEKPINKLHTSVNQQERCSTSSSVTDEDKVDNNAEGVKGDNESSEKTIENMTTNDEASTSSLLQPGNEKLASEYEQFMKMVCTTTDATKEYSPKKNSVKSTSPHSYHEFNIESNLTEDNTNMEIPLKEKFEKKDKLQTLEGSIKSTECEESTLSTDCQIQTNENNVQIECTNENDEDSKSVPSDWENVRIKVERLSDENTESREVKKKKKQKKITSSSDSSSSTISSDSEKEKKKRKRKRKVLSNSSSSDSDSTDSSSSSSDSSSSEEKRKRKRKKKKVGKKRKKARRTARIKKKRRRKMNIDSNSSDSDEYTKKKKKSKKKTIETKSINNGDISKVISKSPVIASSSDGTKIALHSVTPVRKIKEEAASEDRKRTDQVISTKKTIADISEDSNECLKQKKERNESKSDESFMEQWEMDSMTTVQQNDGDTSSQDRIRELEKVDGSEKDKYRRKRKQSRDNEQNKDRSSKVNEERIHEGKARSDEEAEAKKKKRREKDIRNSTEFLANWEREGERITQQIQNEAKYLKKLGKQKKEKWGETDFDTLNVPSLTQLEKEVYQKQLLADEWEVDSLEAISDLIANKRKNNLSSLKKIEKEVRYDKKTDTYIAIEKESVREMKKKQERLCAIRIWEEEQEEGEREEMMLLEQKSKRKTDDWDIEEESLFRKNIEEIEARKINDIVVIEKEWIKTDETKNMKEDANKLTIKSGSKRVKKSRWDMGSQSEEKSEVKDIWEEEYADWSKINKCEQEFEKTKKGEFRTDCSESSSKSDLIDFYHRKLQSRESLERSWASEEVAIRPVQAKKDVSMKHLISAKTNEEQLTSNKEHQTKDQYKEILESNVELKEKIIELYSPSSPALSQKSQDVEVSNGSSSCNSLLREKKKKEMLITADELSIPMSGIPLQLIKPRDTKHVSNEKIENIVNKVQLEDKDSVHNFDIKTADNLFDDISMNEPCPKVHISGHMDIFAEYGLEKSCNKQHAASSNVSSATHTKDEASEGKNALKLIPKQLLIRRTNEQIKPKRVLETPLQDPAQHAAALLTIQKKLLESHALKSDIKEYSSEEQANHFEQRYSTASNSGTDNALLDITEFSVVSKSSVIATRHSRSPASEKAISVRSEQSESYDKESKNDDVKRYRTNRNLSDNVPSNVQSPVREHRKRSPSRKESEKRYLHDKDKKERKSDDAEKPDRRDARSSKTDFADRRRSSPLGRGRRRRSGSPYASWERQGSGSGSSRHSWSRSCSKSPKRKDEATNSTRDRDKKRERYDDERSNRSRVDERKERYTRSPPRFNYNEDNFKKHGIASSKSNRDDWGRRRHDNIDRDHEKDIRSYDPMEILRERTMESEKYRDNRFHTEEMDHTFWQYESSNILRDGNESIDSYTVGQDLPLEYDDRTYYREGSLERDMIQSSPQSVSKYRRRSNTRRERQWEKDKDPSDLNRHGHRLRNRTPPRSRYSPVHQASERFRRKSRSRSKSWSPLRSRSRSRSESRSRSTSRSRPRMRSQSRSRSRSPLDTRSRGKSASMSRLRSPEHVFRMSELRSSRSPSPGRDRLNEIGRERKDDDENKNFNVCTERGRRIETIVQSGIIPGPSILDSEMGINSNMDAVANFQYSNEIEGGNEYYYTENNLTYPPCIDESSTSSPKRLSLDDRLELELGIKKQHCKDSTGIVSEYSNFNPNVIAYPSPPPQQQQQMMYRQQPTVVQVGNVLQVVPADFNGVQSARREVPAAVAIPPVRAGSSQVVRVGNVLQVVPTSLDWSSSSGGGGSGNAGQSSSSSSTADQSSGGILYSSAVPALSPSAPSVPMSVPVPVPVPLPVPPALPAATNTLATVATRSPAAPLPLSLPVPVPVPVPIPPATTAAFSRNEVQPQKIVQPVYNYEAILETRHKEREERKRLRRKEKERRRIERINRRALRLLEKNNTSRQTSGVLLDHRKGSVMDPSVLKALKEGEEQVETESPSANSIKEEEETTTSVKEEDEDAAADEEDDDEDEIEAEAEDDEEEEEEAEDEDEDDDDDEKPLQMINQRIEIDETTTTFADANKDPVEIETKKEWPELPPPPLKGILVVPGFRRDAIPNGNLDDLSDVDDNIKDGSDKDEEIDKNNECDKDAGPDTKFGKSNVARLKKNKRNKKSVQFADGIKPGEGTSPSGGEGDMPSPPPPKGIGFREGFRDLRKDKIYNSRKSRKQEKRARPPKTKKKVKVKIIKLKKPRISPLAMMMDDSDEMDDRSPPPPPPGSPPPPHLWPSYLSIYNTTVRAIEQPQTTITTLTPVQAPPPPTPLPLLIPPPPLNYTIQPCSKS